MVTKTRETHKIRVLVTKVGLDRHHFGARLIASALRDAGMEVVYIAGDLWPEQIAEIALQEDVDVVGISILSGNHLILLPECVESLRKKGKGDALLICGGIIPKEDRAFLKQAGVHGIFGPDTKTQEVVTFIKEHFERAQARA